MQCEAHLQLNKYSVGDNRYVWQVICQVLDCVSCLPNVTPRDGPGTLVVTARVCVDRGVTCSSGWRPSPLTCPESASSPSSPSSSSRSSGSSRTPRPTQVRLHTFHVSNVYCENLCRCSSPMTNVERVKAL